MNVLDIWMNGIFGDTDDFRFSLAGAQEKTALLWHEGAWHIPLGATQLHMRNVKMAMALRTKNAHYRMHEIYRRHWFAVGKRISGRCSRYNHYA